MNFKFDKKAAKACAEQLTGRLNQYVNDMADDKAIGIDEFAEGLTFCFLNELTEFNLSTKFAGGGLNQFFANFQAQAVASGVTIDTMESTVDPQMIITAGLGMQHAC